MSEHKIEKGIPIPNVGLGRPKQYHFYEKMEVGDSVFVPGKKATQVMNTVQHWRRKTGFRFLSRTLDGGCRVWRIE